MILLFGMVSELSSFGFRGSWNNFPGISSNFQDFFKIFGIFSNFWKKIKKRFPSGSRLKLNEFSIFRLLEWLQVGKTNLLRNSHWMVLHTRGKRPLRERKRYKKMAEKSEREKREREKSESGVTLQTWKWQERETFVFLVKLKSLFFCNHCCCRRELEWW